MAQEKIPEEKLAGVTGGGHGTGHHDVVEENGYIWSCSKEDLKTFKRHFNAGLLNLCKHYESAFNGYVGRDCRECIHIESWKKI